jgi:hypothetical protein
VKFKYFFKVVFVFFVIISISTELFAVTIQDNYIGAGPTHADWVGKDIVGETSKFDVASLTMQLTGDILKIDIKGSYFDNVGSYGTHFGDIFLSSDGWKPFGSSPYLLDDASNGENWEYAIVFSDHGKQIPNTPEGQSMIGASGQASLVRIDRKSDIELSFADGIYRAGQEVTVKGNSLNNVFSLGTWSIVNDSGGYSILSVSTSILGTQLANAADIGVHFGYSCGNDVIEGSASRNSLVTTSVPEPASVILFASALLFASPRRKKV